jgi:hypothetical protein
METTKDINRLKVVLAEKKRTNKWLAEQLGKDPAKGGMKVKLYSVSLNSDTSANRVYKYFAKYTREDNQ